VGVCFANAWAKAIAAATVTSGGLAIGAVGSMRRRFARAGGGLNIALLGTV
jgi:hypothetical protein